MKTTKSPLFEWKGPVRIAILIFLFRLCFIDLYNGIPDAISRKVPSTPEQTKGNKVLPEKTTQFQTTLEKCISDQLEMFANSGTSHFKSQSNEDRTLIDNFFNGLCGGTYLEMGGLNGVRFSNTYVFNTMLGWKGVLVELGPKNFKQLQVNRPNEIATVHAGVCAEKKTLHYVEKGPVGGIWEFAAESFRKQWWNNIEVEKAPTIECSPLKDILLDYAGNTTYYDFFSLDIEGAEFDALQSLDYSKVAFGIIFAEADEHNLRKNNALRTFLDDKGYAFLWTKDRSDWFINENFHSIYKNVVH
jgi:hypothetical protein